MELTIGPTVKRVIQPFRRQPFHLQKAIDQENLLDNDVIEEAKGPVTWFLEIVPVPKPKKPGQIRITVGARAANKAIFRDPIAMPTTEEVIHELNGAKFLSEMDLNKAFH